MILKKWPSDTSMASPWGKIQRTGHEENIGIRKLDLRESRGKC